MGAPDIAVARVHGGRVSFRDSIAGQLGDSCGMDVDLCIQTGQLQCNMVSGSTIGILDSEHIHADWKVYINNKVLDFSDDAKSMLLDIFKLHQAKRISEINSIVEKATNTTNEIISTLSPENRSKDFSSGKKFDRVTWATYQMNFIENGYSELAASLLAGVFIFEFDELLSKWK